MDWWIGNRMVGVVPLDSCTQSEHANKLGVQIILATDYTPEKEWNISNESSLDDRRRAEE